jgi:hypothetical protein
MDECDLAGEGRYDRAHRNGWNLLMPLARPSNLRGLLYAALFVLGLSCSDAATSQALSPGSARNDYAKAENWLCRPGRDDACAVDLSTTIVAAEGTLTRTAFHADADAPIDCFYLYPTVSRDQTPNSDMQPGEEERGVIRQQFARFASVCRPYAPLYRQMTVMQLRKAIAGGGAGDPAMAYGDVVDAWTYYLQHDNHGRGVVLIGHSQGAGMLQQLMQDQIDGKPLQKRLVSAILAGTDVDVPKGRDVGATFKSIALCRTPAQTGCVISYDAFRATRPPGEDSILEAPADRGIERACTNPANLAGGEGTLDAYLASHTRGFGDSAPAPIWVRNGPDIATPFVEVPGLLSARCADSVAGAYLAITVHGDPSDPRADDISGDVVTHGEVRARWGLHSIDIDLAVGNLIDIVRAQARHWMRVQPL